jgi:hypothetical protein
MGWMDMLNELEESEIKGGDFSPLPDGWYPAMTSQSIEKNNKSNDGHHVQVTFTIDDGAFKGRLVWGTYNIDNPSPTAQQIGLGEMKRMMLASGVEKMSDVSDLDDRFVWIKVATDKKQPDRNVIKAYRADAPDAEAKPALKAAAKAEAAPVKKPWSKK